MGKGIFGQLGNRATHALDQIVFGTLAFGYTEVGGVGDKQEQLLNLVFGGFALIGILLAVVLEKGCLFLCGGGFFLLAFLHENAYRL